jgi:U3 small nucleolar RNA-associated protein 5
LAQVLLLCLKDLPFEKEQTILIREVPTNLLLSTMRTQRKKSEPGKVTITGPVPKQEKTSSEAVLEDLVEGPLQKKARQTRPSTESLSQLIVQAVTSQDGNLLESALSSQGKERTIRSTVEKLPSSVVLPFIAQLIEKIEVKPSRCTKLLVWIRNCLTCHMTYLSTVPMATGALGYLEELSAVHLSSYERLCRLHGKLDVLLSRISQSTISSTSAFTPLLVHEIDTDDKLTDDDESDWSDSEGDSQSNQGEESLESDELLSND